MINRLLVANRGEIASRVFATCRRLGIETVAVTSDADAHLPYVREADWVLRMPGNTPAETYLDGNQIIAGALRMQADAIHPGYGFLSENAEFARAVEQAGLTWVGPAPDSIDTMGSKIGAKEIMRAAGVPVLESFGGLDTPSLRDGTRPAGVAGEASRPPGTGDLPLLVKASAGGGGRGMRVVRDLADLEAEIEKASAEAASAFGDGTVFVEPYVENSRHIEVQVVGDPVLGMTHVLGERDCSIQRRHQKVVEETPAPGLTDQQRQSLHDAARKAADAIGYRGAGTVEFLVDAADPSRFFFLEMNTRLQVEHPVTEAVTGLDLVEFQIAVAEGRAVEADEPLPGHGHAIEVRLYAEDPAQEWQPQSGRLDTFEIPHDAEFETPARYGIRLDSGFSSGSEVSTYYDAMLAKVISWAPTRDQATRQLVSALRRARIHGLTTNRDLLIATLTDESFASGSVSTAFFGASSALSAPARTDGALVCAATAAVALDAGAARLVQQGIPVGWRNVVSAPQTVEWEGAGRIEWLARRDGLPAFPSADFTVLEARPIGRGWRIDYEGEGESSYAEVSFGPGLPGTRRVYVDGPAGSLSLTEVPRFTDPATQHKSGSLLAPMPGSVVRVDVEPGQTVEEGTVVLVLEAMKMQHTVTAPHAGTVTEINVHAGAQVAAGEVLAVVEENQ